jgi:two-component system, NarL family, sensor histidine kinase ComP
MKSLRSIPPLIWCLIVMSYMIPFLLLRMDPLSRMTDIILLLPTIVLGLMVCQLKTSNNQLVKEKQRADEESQRLQGILNNLQAGIWHLDLRTGDYFVSAGIERISGYSSGHVQGNLNVYDDFIHPEDHSLVREMESGLLGGAEKSCEFRLIRPDGEIRWCSSIGRTETDAHQTVVKIYGLLVDITEKKAVEEELHRTKEQLQSLLDNLDAAIYTLDVSTMKGYCSPGITKLTGYSNDLFNGSLFWKQLIHREDLAIFNQDMEAMYAGDPAASEYRILNRHGETKWIHMRCFPTLAATGELLRVDGFIMDITGKKLLEQSIARSEERYRRLVELSPLPISIYKDNAFTYVNPAGVRVLGASHMDELIGIPVLDYIIPEYQQKAIERVELTLRDHYAPPYTYQVKRLDGSIVDLEMTGIYDEQSESIQIVFLDITDRLRAERTIKESENKYRRLVEMSPHGIAEHQDGRFSYVNPAAVKLLGAETPEQLIGRNVSEIVEPGDHQCYYERVKQTLEQGYTPLLEYKVVRLDGMLIDVEAASIHDEDMEKILVVFYDITDRKITEASLQASEERYFFLQTSLDHFSRDLGGVMKIDELERRLVKEIQDVLQIPSVYLIVADPHRSLRMLAGDMKPSGEFLSELLMNYGSLPMAGEIVELQQGYAVKVAEVSGSTYVLCIEGDVHDALTVTSKKVWLQTIVRYVNVLYDNFRVIEDLTLELQQHVAKQEVPAWLLRLIFTLSENERKRLSQDLHDAALQEQIIWLRRLEGMICAEDTPQAMKPELEKIQEGLLDVVHQIRLTCNELRPPFLKEWGLVPALESLFDYTQLHSDYSIEFEAAGFNLVLTDEQMISLYRIVQELLSNASKHSCASLIRIELHCDEQQMNLLYKDNGVGMELSEILDSFESMGMYGIRERVRSLEGEIEIESMPSEGLRVNITLPLQTQVNALPIASSNMLIL